MRVTTQMLNETAKRTGIPINQTNLLSYINNSGQTGGNTLLDALKDAKEKKYRLRIQKIIKSSRKRQTAFRNRQPNLLHQVKIHSLIKSRRAVTMKHCRQV